MSAVMAEDARWLSERSESKQDRWLRRQWEASTSGGQRPESKQDRWLSGGQRPESKPRDALDEALDAAECLPRPADRYVAAYALALQVAALALTGRPRRRSLRGSDGRARNVWAVLADVAPDLGEWAEFFAALQLKRQAVEAGASGLVNAREADDLVRAVRDFRGAVLRHG